MASPWGKNSHVIYLDEIDVLQMTYAAIEIFPRETYGILLGAVSHSGHRNIYRVHFIQVLQKGSRETTRLEYPLQEFIDLHDKYDFSIIGEYHSHPGDCDPGPSHADLNTMAVNYPAYINNVFCIIHIFRGKNRNYASTDVISRKKTKLVCYHGEFEAHLNFFVVRDERQKFPRNKSARSMVERVYPKCTPRKKIYKKNWEAI